MIKWMLIPGFSGFICACQITPSPICADETYKRAQKEIYCMFSQQEPVIGEMDFNQAMSRGLQYNLDLRVNKANAAIKTGQLRLAQLALLPEVNLLASNYARNNDNATFGSNPDGTPSRTIAFGSDKIINSNRVEIKWNILELGRGYIKAKEEAEHMLIAEEESRKQLQKLVQDLRVTYWRAYNAQELCCELKQFQEALALVKDQLNDALQDKTIPKENLLNFQAELLTANRKLVQLEDKLYKAELQLKYLINVPADQAICLKKPPHFLNKIQDLRGIDFCKLDAITLVNRPELRSQNYQRRIAKLGIKAAIVQALPGLTVNAGRSFNSNSFLVNRLWTDSLADSSWNVFTLASLPVSMKKARTQTSFETLKLMALSVGALNETRLACEHYETLARESAVARRQTENARKMYLLQYNREKASLASKQQVVLSKLQLIFARMDEIVLLSDLSTALGELYLFSGFDVLPPELTFSCACAEEVICAIEQNLLMQDTMDFKQYVNLTFEKMFENCESNS